jgi:hypothetical protein
MNVSNHTRITAEKTAEIGYFGAYVITDRIIEFGQQRQLLLYWQRNRSCAG